jgi:hypothetical protein
MYMDTICPYASCQVPVPTLALSVWLPDGIDEGRNALTRRIDAQDMPSLRPQGHCKYEHSADPPDNIHVARAADAARRFGI